MKIKKKQNPEVNPKFWDFFVENENKRFMVLVGGAGSGKSYSIAQWFVKKLFTVTGKKFLVVRKTFPALKLTAMQLILDLLDEYQLPYDLNQSAPVTLIANGNRMIFRGLDDPEKVKSFEPDFIWMEEASDFNKKDFIQLNLRMRGISDITKQIYMSLNPVDKSFSWIYEGFWERERKNAAILQTTWRDNRRHLDDEYISELEGLEEEDQTLYDIYNLGLWGVLKNIIYANWNEVPSFPQAIGDRFYGLDFGYSNPMGLTEIRYVDKEIYEKELLYETHLTTPELIEKMKELIPDKSCCIYADSAEPDRIVEIRRAGFNIFPARKDVILGIDFVKRFKTHIVSGSPNLIKEKKGYKYKEDEKIGEIFEVPVKWHDHLMDAERYAIFTHLWRLVRKLVGRKEKVTKEILGVP